VRDGRIGVVIWTLGALSAAGILASAVPAAASGNGIAAVSPRQILAKATKAQSGARSFTVTGLVRDGSQTTGLKVTASSTGNGFGSVSLNGETVQIIKVGPNVYFRSGSAFWAKQGGATAAELFANKWVEGPASNADFSQLASFFSTAQLTSQFLGDSSSSAILSRAGTSSINGQPVLVLKGHDRTNSAGGSIFIATTGQPYVIRVSLAKGGGATGVVTFSRFNAPVNPRAPKGAINIGQLKGASSAST
jgi:hypothetical protein